jgi:hypothetical protein
MDGWFLALVSIVYIIMLVCQMPFFIDNISLKHGCHLKKESLPGLIFR